VIGSPHGEEKCGAKVAAAWYDRVIDFLALMASQWCELMTLSGGFPREKINAAVCQADGSS
jgi:hypothetical protein